jgi:hypothetical protein
MNVAETEYGKMNWKGYKAGTNMQVKGQDREHMKQLFITGNKM